MMYWVCSKMGGGVVFLRCLRWRWWRRTSAAPRPYCSQQGLDSWGSAQGPASGNTALDCEERLIPFLLMAPTLISRRTSVPGLLRNFPP